MATSAKTETYARTSPKAWRGSIYSPLTQPAFTAPLPWTAGSGAAGTVGLLVADVVAFVVAVASGVLLVLAVRGGTPVYPWGMAHPLNMWIAGLAWLVLRGNGSLYRPAGIAPPEELRRNVQATLFAAALHGGMLFAFTAKPSTKLVAAATWLCLVPLGILIREFARTLLLRMGRYGDPVVVAGAGETAAVIVRELRATPEIGLVPIAAFDDDPAKHGTLVEGVPVLASLREAAELPGGYQVRHALVALPSLSSREVTRLVEALERRFPKVTVIPALMGLGSLNVRARSLGVIAGLEVADRTREAGRLFLKRAIDFALGTPLFVVSAPVIGLAALVVRIVSPGPGFYSQVREGKDGKRIRVWKIRTMVVDAERKLAEHLATNAEARAEWERTVKLKNDPRIVPLVGNFLRRTSLDELPQLWNVVSGELSLVGPRPFPIYHLEKFSPEFRTRRSRVTPGLTGLWQVSHRSDGDLAVQQAADSYYIQNQSFWLDFWILVRTFKVVVKGTGAY